MTLRALGVLTTCREGLRNVYIYGESRVILIRLISCFFQSFFQRGKCSVPFQGQPRGRVIIFTSSFCLSIPPPSYRFQSFILHQSFCWIERRLPLVTSEKAFFSPQIPDGHVAAFAISRLPIKTIHIPASACHLPLFP